MAGYYFRLPAITQLTIPQQAAVNEPNQIALSGGPGTGKSVVSLWRHIRNYQKRPVPTTASFLSTYTTTLRVYLAACCRKVRDEAYPKSWLYSSQNVGTSLKNSDKIHNIKFKEVIIDEAQDLSVDYYDDIASPVSYGADDSQILHPDHCSLQTELNNIYSENVSYVLDKNFRNTQRIMQFAKQAFPYANIPISTIHGLSNNIGEKPVLLVSNGNKYELSNEKQDNAIERIINSFHADDHNIAILVPWKKDAQFFENVLKSKNIEHSIYYTDSKRFPLGCEEDLKNVHITTFKSAKGLEFDTVIIPNFNIINRTPIYYMRNEKMTEKALTSLKNTINRLARLRKDHDVILSETRTPDGLINVIYRKLMCSWEDVYVACTRARSNLYLISNFNLPQLSTVTEKEIL